MNSNSLRQSFGPGLALKEKRVESNNNPYMQHVPKLDLRYLNKGNNNKESKNQNNEIIDNCKLKEDGTGWLCPKKLP